MKFMAQKCPQQLNGNYLVIVSLTSLLTVESVHATDHLYLKYMRILS